MAAETQKLISHGMRHYEKDAGLEQIAAWEALHLTGTLQQMKDDGLDADTIAREYPAKEAMIAGAADKMRELHLANRARSPQP
jgi:demethoxyubiquinone hydroxylase (CLK1/Coq7/Cat5 family)